MILVDSSVWIDYLRDIETPQTDLMHRMLGHAELCLGDLILAEVLQGIRDEREHDRVQRMIATFPTFDLVGLQIAVAAARNFRLLRAKGVTVRKTIDTLIATFCIENGLALLYSDRDFHPFATHLGLQRAYIES